MKKLALIAVIVIVPLVGLVNAPSRAGQAEAGQGAQPEPDLPPPGEHHKWLEQLVGTWDVESKMVMGEGAPPMTFTGTDVVRSLGGRWVIGDLTSEVPGLGKLSAVLTLGYKPETGKYQGTWVDSVTDQLWVYVGTLDATRTILTLEAEGPNMMDPTKGMTQYRDVIEIKSEDHRTLTSSALLDGAWVEFGKADYRRTK